MAIVKSRKGRVAVLALMILGLMVFPVCAGEYTQVGTLQSVADDLHQELNTIKVTAGAGELTNGDVVLIRLPADFNFNSGGWSYGIDGANVYYGDYDSGCYIFVPWDEENGLNMATDLGGNPVPTDIFTVEELDDNEFTITVKDIPSITEDALFFIYLKDVDVPRGFRGAITLTIDAPSGSGFGESEILSGRVGRLQPEEEEPVVPPEDDKGVEPDDEDTEGDELDGVPVEGLKAVFTIGNAAYTVNGEAGFMDVAPYIKSGRTYLPMRFVALALGVNEKDILWVNGTASFILEGRNVSLTVGSKMMMVNGDTVSVDAAPEVFNGRLMLPVKWIGSAFGADVSWDGTTRMVTVSKQ